jgi:hypothetical protein
MVACGSPEIGPYAIRGIDTVTNVTLSTNETAIKNVETVLNEFEFVGVVLESNKFDCSDISELIWYVLNNNGMDALLVGNCIITDDTIYGHMFVWVNASDGMIVVESTGENWTTSRLGEVMHDPPDLYTSGWVWSSPTKFLLKGKKDDMRGITLDTPIEELPIRRKK